MRDITLADTIYISFSTRAFATGIPTTLSGIPVVSAYEDAGLTQITAGITLGVDHDSVTGLNMLTIVATGANGFESGKDYNLVITTGTVGGVSAVGEAVGGFTIERTPVNWANVTNPTTALDLSGTDIQLVDTVTALTGKTGFSLAATGLDAIASTATGMVEIAKAIWDRVLSAANHNVPNSAGRRVRQLQDSGSYTGGGAMVYLDTVNGVAGTTDYENGTITNPVDTIGDVNTILASLPAYQVYVTPNSTFAPTGNFLNKNVYGIGYTCTLGGHDYAGTHIYHASPLSGVATSSADTDHFDVLDSIIGDVTVDDAHFTNCSFKENTLTFGSVSSTVRLINCRSVVAGATTPIIDFGTVAATSHQLTVANWQNGIEIANFNNAGTDLMSLSGTGQLIIGASCAGGTINLRGQWKITDNASGAVSITYDGVAQNIIDILADTANMQPKLGTPDGTDISADIALLQADTDDIQTRLPAALVSGKMDSDAVAISGSTDSATRLLKATQCNVYCTVGSSSTTTSIVTSAMDPAAAATDQFKGKIVTFDANTTTANLRGQSTDITANTSVGVLTVTALTTAAVSGDTFVIT